MDALSMSKAKCRKIYVQENGEPYDKIVIGAIIAKQGIGGGKPEILLLKRAAHETVYPNIWEIPGGKVEDSDPTILDAVKREVFEETNMTVEKVVGAVSSFDYFMEKTVVMEGGGETTVRSTSGQLNFICEVAKYEFAINPEEHSQGKFVWSWEVMDLEMTEQMRAVKEGLTWTEGYSVGLMKP
ncbi:MAG: hypothetical protein Q9225_004675 [Loekoesia sp. 1 TL-2023]